MLCEMRLSQPGSTKAQMTMAASGGVPRRFLLYTDPVPPKWQAAWTTFERIERAFADTVASDGPHFAIVAVPAAQIVDAGVWKDLLGQFPAMASAQWGLEDPAFRLAGIANRLGVPLVTTVDDFRAALSGTPLFFGRIGHMTERGHSVMAS